MFPFHYRKYESLHELSPGFIDILGNSISIEFYTETMVEARIFFKGKVQGVWFRANCQKKAIELDLSGWVRNLDNGDVECFCSGE